MEKSRQELEDLAEQFNIIDNNTQEIDPIEVRGQYQAERDSTLNKIDDGLEVSDVSGRKALVYSAPQTASEVTANTLVSKDVAEDLSSESVAQHVAETDPHTQYHNDAKGDARYYLKSEVDSSQGIQNTSISNNSSNISTNTSAISTNTSDILDNANDISTNITDIGINEANITSNESSIIANTGAIVSNSNGISQNVSDISTNASNISTNVTSIGTNSTNISNNASNISANSSNISTNASNISNNSTDINNNSTDISNNATNISTNTGAISVNSTNISTNTGNISTNTSNISGNTSLINDNASDISNIQSEQITQNDAIALNTAKVSADGSVDTHSDVDLTGLTVGNNFVLKYDGSNYIPCLSVLIDAPTLIINNTNQAVDIVNTNVDVQRLKPHKITISYGWSLNDAGQDFESFATFGGQDLNQGLTDNNPIHIQEPKDVGGADPDGRGTNQRQGFSRSFIVTPTSLGNNSLLLQMSGSANGDLASIWGVKIEVEEYINVNNL